MSFAEEPPPQAETLAVPGQSSSQEATSKSVPPPQSPPTPKEEPPSPGADATASQENPDPEIAVLFGLDQSDHLLPAPDAGNPKAGWIVSFADLMTLLLCFFILLYASSTLDLEKFRRIAESMSAALGGKTVIYVPIPEKETPPPTRPAETDLTPRLRRTMLHAEQLRSALSPEINQRRLDVTVDDQLIVLNILQNGSFETGSAVLHPGFLAIAKKIRTALAEVPGDITVAGHTDNQPISGGNFRSNWELSGARAYSVMHELLKDDVLPKDRFVLKGCGETQPRMANTSEANREQNRRVEIVIDQRGMEETGPVIDQRAIKNTPDLFPAR